MTVINNKRIAKNTVLLYLRMLLLMGVTLYTSRIILQALGIADYGIYNLIGGFVTLFAIVTNTLVIATQRFLNFALGVDDNKRFDNIFIMSINIMFLISILIILLSETIGVWFIYNYLNIPDDRIIAAIWVFRFSVYTFVINLLRTPYNAAIISFEKMAFYAYISILEVILKLLVVYLLLWTDDDRLILYAILYFIINVLVTLGYKFYCNQKLKKCNYKFLWDKALFKELLSFTGWSLFGQAGYVLRGQGDSFLVNRFYSVAVNAAMGVNSQVTGAITLFVSNFQTAFRPQLIKSYASNQMEGHLQLLFRSSKFSYFLLLVLVLPIIFNIEFILNIWLVKVPNYTSSFIILGLISQLILALSAPFATSILATGKIKNYQVFLFIVNVGGLIVSYIFFKIGYAPYLVSFVNIAVQLLILIFRIVFVNVLIESFKIKDYLYKVVVPAVSVTILSILLPFFTNKIIDSVLEIVVYSAINVIFSIFVIYSFGLSKNEKEFFHKMINKLLFKIYK